MYLSDRHRVEICLPAQMILAVSTAGISDLQQKTKEFIDYKDNLLAASRESVDDLGTKERNKVLARVMRVHLQLNQMLDIHPDDKPKIALIWFHLIRFIIEDEYLQYEAGGPFDLSINKFMTTIEHHAQHEKLNQSSIKQAKKILKSLQHLGYYRGVVPNDD